MKNIVSDHILEEKLKSYMNSGVEKTFQLDEKRLLKSMDKQYVTWFSKKAPVVAVIVLAFLISTMMIPSVRAAVDRLFVFIPGKGISGQGDSAIYIMHPIVKKTEATSRNGNIKFHAQLDNVVYSNEYLNVTTTIKGKYIDLQNDSALYINGEKVDYASWGSSWLGAEGVEANHNIWLKMDEPVSDVLYEVEITGFPERLSFTLGKCLEYSELAQIGPTDTQNGISITTTASRSVNRLTVWCYPLNTTEDRITGIGFANPSIWSKETYIETESGFVGVYNSSGQRIVERFVCDIPGDDSSATLHIPYLTLVRDEKKNITVPVPAGYSSEECDISAEFSLGTVRITEVERKPGEYDGKHDVLKISFAYTSADSKMVFNSFDLRDKRGMQIGGMRKFNEDTGCLEFIETAIKGNTKKLTFTISDLCYYLMGEYVIPLEIK